MLVQESLGAGSLPTNELIEGGIVLFGGALLLTPGFLTDAIGFMCLLPPSRKVIAVLLRRWFKGRIEVGGPGAFKAGGWQFRAGGVRPGPGAAPRPKAERIVHPPPKWSDQAPHPQTGRLDMGAHVGRAPAPQTIDAAFSVVEEDED